MHLQTDAAGKFASARTISSPWPILANTFNNCGERILGILRRITIVCSVRQPRPIKLVKNKYT